MPDKTRHHTFTRRQVKAESKDTLGLNLGDLRRFLADCEAAGVSDKQPITVGGLSAYAVIIDEKWYWTRRIEVHTFVEPEVR